MVSCAALAAALPVFPAAAQSALAPPEPAVADPGGGTAADTAPPVPGDAAKAHPDEDQAIVITGTKRPAGDVLGNVSVLGEEELAHDLKPSLGDTLADLPGVSASSFGPTASRPILRGLSGERAGVLVDGLSSLDLSASDPDHAVTINPLTADRIEVLRGPGALLYGSSAIGGVVNVIDSRIPRKLPEGVDADVLLNYGTAANERSGNAGVEVPLGVDPTRPRQPRRSSPPSGRGPDRAVPRPAGPTPGLALHLLGTVARFDPAEHGPPELRVDPARG